MTKKLACVTAVLLSCYAVFAQSPAPGDNPASAGNPAPAGNSAAAASSNPNSAVTSTDGTEMKEFQKIEDTWSNSVNARDQYGLELVLSPLFVDISASGDVTTRNQQLAQVINSEDKTMHLDQRIITVRLLGDIAVANGTYVLHHKVSSNQVDEKGVFTHVFERQHNHWVCVNSQRTVLHQEGPGTKKKKQSDAELPFHFPLFSKSDKTNQ